MKYCKTCGAGIPGKGNQRYCGEDCNPGGKETSRHCAFCGKEIIGRKRKHCNALCRVAYRKQRRKADLIKTCFYCGESFSTHRKAQRFCSLLCAQRGVGKEKAIRNGGKGTKAECPICNKHFIKYGKQNKLCSVACKNTYIAQHNRRAACACKQCGKEFIPKAADRTKYCSRECAFKDSKNRFKGYYDEMRRHRDEAMVGEYKIGKACKVWFGKRETCGEWFSARNAKAVTCKEYKCKQIRTMRRVYSTGKEYGKEYMCPDCGVVHTIEYGDWGHKGRGRRCKECSAKKTRRAQHCRRKARIRGASIAESIDPLYILRQYRWTCYLCGKKMDPKLYGEPLKKGDPRLWDRPTIDHVVPVSNGGSHTKDNLRACCFGCNMDKGALSLETKEKWVGRYSGQRQGRMAVVGGRPSGFFSS